MKTALRFAALSIALLGLMPAAMARNPGFYGTWSYTNSETLRLCSNSGGCVEFYSADLAESGLSCDPPRLREPVDHFQIMREILYEDRHVDPEQRLRFQVFDCDEGRELKYDLQQLAWGALCVDFDDDDDWEICAAVSSGEW